MRSRRRSFRMHNLNQGVGNRLELRRRIVLAVACCGWPNSSISAEVSTGFTRWSSKPASRVRSRSSSVPHPVRAIREACLPTGNNLMRLAASIPSFLFQGLRCPLLHAAVRRHDAPHDRKRNSLHTSVAAMRRRPYKALTRRVRPSRGLTAVSRVLSENAHRRPTNYQTSQAFG